MSDPRLHYRTPLRETPLHGRVAAANRHHRWAGWAGCLAALDLGDPEMEHAAIRSAATLYDLSPMVKYAVEGPDAAAYLDRLTLRDAGGMATDAVRYTAWCDDAGHVLDDGTLFRLGEHEFRLCCQERHLPWLLDAALGFDVTVREVTDEIAALSLQGPCSAAVLAAAGVEVAALRPFRTLRAEHGSGGLLVSRTGFTGDLGYELWCAPADATALWDRLMEAGAPWGIRPVGSAALDLARIEAGFLVAGTDFVPAEQALRPDRARSPFELGLDWMIDWDKGHFNGRRALLAERAAGSTWALVGLDVDGNVAAEGALVYHRKTREVGHVTSAAWSPSTKASIAIAQIRRPYDSGADLWVEIHALRELRYAKLMERARVVPRPFFAPSRRRATPPETS